MKSGSALLSLVVGMLIASIVSIVLINSLHQFITIDKHLNNNIDQTKRFIVAWQQLEKDLAGACIVHQATRNKKKDSNKKTVKNDQASNEKKEEKKPLKECFLLKGNPTEQILLSAVTTNGKEPHWPLQSIGNSSFLKRITYAIEKDPKNKGSFRLMRHEDTDLAFKKSPKSTVLLDHIASFSVTASYRVYIKEKQADAKQNNQAMQKTEKQNEAKIAFKTTSQWNDSFVYEQDEEFVSRIPDTLFITYELFDNQYKKRSAHTQLIHLASEGFYALMKEQSLPQQIPVAPNETDEETVSIDPFGKSNQIDFSKTMNGQPTTKKMGYNGPKIVHDGVLNINGKR